MIYYPAMKSPTIDIKKELKQKGLRVTTPREKILSVFSAECQPMNAESIHAQLKSIDLVTIYRTLTSFEKCGILRKVDLHKDSTYYELNHHHHHIVCTSCGVIEAFESCDIKKLTQKVVLQSSRFKTIQDHSLEFFGVCKICLKG